MGCKIEHNVYHYTEINKFRYRFKFIDYGYTYSDIILQKESPSSSFFFRWKTIDINTNLLMTNRSEVYDVDITLNKINLILTSESSNGLEHGTNHYITINNIKYRFKFSDYGYSYYEVILHKEIKIQRKSKWYQKVDYVRKMGWESIPVNIINYRKLFYNSMDLDIIKKVIPKDINYFLDMKYSDVYDYRQIQSIDCSNYNIVNLNGIEKLTNLTHIYLNSNPNLINLDGIEKMEKIIHIYHNLSDYPIDINDIKKFIINEKRIKKLNKIIYND